MIKFIRVELEKPVGTHILVEIYSVMIMTYQPLSPGSYLTYLHHQSPLQRNDNMLDHGFVGISVNVPLETRQVLERDEMRSRLTVDSIHCNICQFVMCILGRSDTYCCTAHNAM